MKRVSEIAEKQIADRVKKLRKAQCDFDIMIESGKTGRMTLATIDLIQDALGYIGIGKTYYTFCEDVAKWYIKHGFCVIQEDIRWAISL